MKNLLSFRDESFKVNFKKNVDVCFPINSERAYNGEEGSCGLRTYAYRTLNMSAGTYIISKVMLDYIVENNKEASCKFSVEKNIPTEILEQYKPFTEHKKKDIANFNEAAAPRALTEKKWRVLQKDWAFKPFKTA